MRNKKAIFGTAIALAVLVPFIAMNATIISSGVHADPILSSGEEDLSLSVQIHTNGAPKIEKAWTTILNRFMDETDINVKTYTGVNVNTQLKAQWDNDNPPDFVFIDGNGLSDAAMVKDGKLLPLDEWFLTATDFDDENTKLSALIDSSLIPLFADGKMYQIPILRNTEGAYYDKAFMDKEGFQIPTCFEEMMSTASAFKAKGVAPLTYPGQYASYLLWSYLMPAYAAYQDQEFWDGITSAKNPEIYRDSRFKDVLERFEQFVKDGNLLNDTVNYSHSQSQSAWFNHKAAAISNGLWLEGEMSSSLAEHPEFQMYFTNSPLRLSSQPETSVIGSNTVAIARYGKHQKNALKFATFLLREDNQKTLVEGYNYLSALRDFDYNDCELTATAKQIFDTIAATPNPVYHRYNWGTVGDIFNTVINGIAEGTLSVDEGIERIINEAKKQ